MPFCALMKPGVAYACRSRPAFERCSSGTFAGSIDCAWIDDAAAIVSHAANLARDFTKFSGGEGPKLLDHTS